MEHRRFLAHPEAHRAFIGSDTALVAPVEIGDGAYVAAGSTITQNVPADALGIARGTQANKPGWAKVRREKLAALKAQKATASNSWRPSRPASPSRTSARRLARSPMTWACRKAIRL